MEKLNSKNRLKYRGISGIYALIYNNVIIYIGQSANIGGRLTAHNNKNKYDTIKNRWKKKVDNVIEKNHWLCMILLDSIEMKLSFKFQNSVPQNC